MRKDINRFSDGLRIRMINKIKYLPRNVNRLFNQRHSNDFSMSVGAAGAVSQCDINEAGVGVLFDPCILRADANYYMYVSDRDNDAIVRLTSADGQSWCDLHTVLSASISGIEWCQKINRAHVCFHNEKWKMWFTGMTENWSAIGYAESSDGLSFKQVFDGPILIPDKTIENNSVMNPCVLIEDGGYRMWYASGGLFEPDVICEAISADGLKWEKVKLPSLSAGMEPYDKHKVGGCDVKRMSDGRLALFYIGYQNLDVARICLAISSDNGENWIRSEENPIVCPLKESWCAHAVYKPSVLFDDSQNVDIWFNGRKWNYEGIGHCSFSYEALFGGEGFERAEHR